MQKVHDTYRKYCGIENIQLKFKEVLAKPDDTVDHFLQRGDDFVLFLASCSDQFQGLPQPESLLPRNDESHTRDGIANEVNESSQMSKPARITFELKNNANVGAMASHAHSIVPPVTSRGKNGSLPLLHVREILETQDPEVLEAGVSISITALDRLRTIVMPYEASHAESQSWLPAIEKLLTPPEQKRTVIGVVGHTGAGKSSVINALLDEERLVPTSCMRACTAVVTEISWNSSTDPSAKYRAEVEFINEEDWAKELNILMEEFLNANGTLSREALNPSSEAGIAWAKFRKFSSQSRSICA